MLKEKICLSLIINVFGLPSPVGGRREVRKKTYVFDDDTLEILENLKCSMNKKEVSIIREALRMYHDMHNNQENLYKALNEIICQLEYITSKIEKLSYELGQCKERNKYLEDMIRKLVGNV